MNIVATRNNDYGIKNVLTFQNDVVFAIAWLEGQLLIKIIIKLSLISFFLMLHAEERLLL